MLRPGSISVSSEIPTFKHDIGFDRPLTVIGFCP